MRYHLARLFLRIECAMHRADAYLASHRGEMLFAADCTSRADECIRQLTILEINRRYA